MIPEEVKVGLKVRHIADHSKTGVIISRAMQVDGSGTLWVMDLFTDKLGMGIWLCKLVNIVYYEPIPEEEKS